MINDIPSGDEFTASALAVLHLAWDVAVGAVADFEQSAVMFDDDSDDWKELSGAERDRAETMFLVSSQTSLANALTLIQQGVELALKGRIAAVSPWLLIVRDPRDFPRGSQKEDVSFSAFRTVDAVDLLKIHDTVCPQRMPLDFGQFWDDLRQRRNAVMHSGKSHTLVTPSSLLETILRVNSTLLGGESWPKRRVAHHAFDFGNSFPVGAARLEDGFGPTAVLSEIDAAVRNLPNAEVKRYLRFDKGKRAYRCPKCEGVIDQEHFVNHEDGVPRLAQLISRSPTCSTIRCVACDQTSKVTRTPCRGSKCRSNVLSDEPDSEGQCLVCGWYQDQISSPGS